MSKKTEDLFCNTNYKLLLKLLRADTSKSKPVYGAIHPRVWIPPPCLTSPPQEDRRKEKGFHKVLDIHSSSSDEMDGAAYFDKSKKQLQRKELSSLEGKEAITHKLKHLKKDKELLRETQLKLQSGEGLASLNDLVHRWRILDENTSKNVGLVPLKPSVTSDSGGRQPSTKLESDDGPKSVDTKRTERALQDLERSFRQAKEEEERLKTKLKRLKKEDKKFKEYKRPAVKLKKNSNQGEYKVLAMKRRYEDLLQYLARLESKNKELKKENEVLHVTLKEETEFPARERIFTLEQELLNRNNELEKFNEQLSVLNAIQEENAALKKMLETLKRFEEKHERERLLKEENFEEEWVKKATDMKILYERAVQGYKEQLVASRTSYDALEQRLRTLIQYYEKDEKDLIERYEREIKSIKAEVNSSKTYVAKEQETIGLLKLETLLEKKDREITKLKESLKEFESTQKEEASEHFQKKVLEKLSEIVTKSTIADESCLESIKDTVKKVFEDFVLTQRKSTAVIDKQGDLLKENENLKGELKEKGNEISILKSNLEHAERNWEKLLTKNRENPAEKIVTVEGKSDSNMEVLREFPRLLKENETKLRDSEAACQKYQIEVRLHQERLRSASAELETKKERISELESSIKDLASSNKKLERENEKLESKIETLEAQIEKKNRILERNSSQIEERIREYRSLVSQMERLREEHSKEIADLKESRPIYQLDPKLQEAQTLNVRLESQLSALRSENTLEEKIAKNHISALEEQMSQLKVRNATLQKHLQTIQDTYKSMFGMEGHLIPFLTLPTTSTFPSRELQMETNGFNPK